MQGKRLSGMVGGTYLYYKEEVTIKTLTPEEDGIYKVTTASNKVFRVSSKELLNDFVPVRTNGHDNSQALVSAMNENLPVNTLGKTLMDTIEKLKTDPGYIGQAQAINETAKTMIDLGKLQVDTIRTMRDLSNR